MNHYNPINKTNGHMFIYFGTVYNTFVMEITISKPGKYQPNAELLIWSNNEYVNINIMKTM